LAVGLDGVHNFVMMFLIFAIARKHSNADTRYCIAILSVCLSVTFQYSTETA